MRDSIAVTASTPLSGTIQIYGYIFLKFEMSWPKGIIRLMCGVQNSPSLTYNHSLQAFRNVAYGFQKSISLQYESILLKTIHQLQIL